MHCASTAVRIVPIPIGREEETSPGGACIDLDSHQLLVDLLQLMRWTKKRGTGQGRLPVPLAPHTSPQVIRHRQFIGRCSAVAGPATPRSRLKKPSS